MSSCQHPKWFSCLENQTIKHFHRDIYPTNLQHILLKKSLFLAPEFSLVDSGNISVWATQHWCWPYTKPWEISSPPCWRCLGSRWRISRIQEIIQDGPSFRLGKQAILEGKQAILEVWGVVLFFFVWNQEICLWKPWYHPFFRSYMLHWFWERGTVRVHFFSRSRMVQSLLSFKILMLKSQGALSSVGFGGWIVSQQEMLLDESHWIQVYAVYI